MATGSVLIFVFRRPGTKLSYFVNGRPGESPPYWLSGQLRLVRPDKVRLVYVFLLVGAAIVTADILAMAYLAITNSIGAA